VTAPAVRRIPTVFDIFHLNRTGSGASPENLDGLTPPEGLGLFTSGVDRGASRNFRKRVKIGILGNGSAQSQPSPPNALGALIPCK